MRWIAALLGMGLIACCCVASDKRPNILLCIADDWGWPHAGVYGDDTVRTPNFDRLARDGMRFDYCFSAAPSCSPSRAAILTGQYPHRLKEGGVLWGFLPKAFPTYPGLLEEAGYHVGSTRKGWGPGRFQAGGYTENPAGRSYRTLSEFLDSVPQGKPFCFWFGSHDPHRVYEPGLGDKREERLKGVRVPPYWPDNEIVRNDLLDYYSEVERFDREIGELLELIHSKGVAEDTLVVVTGDNGAPFPRCKANLYDGGTRQPLAVYWPARLKGGRVSADFVNLMDLAPTFLEAAGLKPPPEMTGRSLLGLLTGREPLDQRNVVFLERERHANVRAGDAGYPMRAIRTIEFLYIRNFRPERWPAGDPKAHKDPKRTFGDVDDGPTKNYILDHRSEPATAEFFQLCFSKRCSEELYDLRTDPDQIRNVAGLDEYLEPQQALRRRLADWMRETQDPRAFSNQDVWDTYPYYGGLMNVNRP